MKLEDLVRFAQELGECSEEQHVDVCVIGGVAMHLVAEEARARDEAELGFEVTHLRVTDSRHLAALPRSTDDIDLVVRRTEEVTFVRVLEQRGFVRDSRTEPPPARYRDDGHAIDVIVVGRPTRPGPGDAPSDLELVLAALDGSFDVDRDVRTHFRIARPEALVILKAVARSNRSEERDLSDFARLALLDLRHGTTRAALIELWPTIPARAQRCLRSIRDDFRTRDAIGPSAFIRVVRAVEPSIASEDVEDDVRDQVVAAVHALLDWLDDVEN